MKILIDCLFVSCHFSFLPPIVWCVDARREVRLHGKSIHLKSEVLVYRPSIQSSSRPAANTRFNVHPCTHADCKYPQGYRTCVARVLFSSYAQHLHHRHHDRLLVPGTLFKEEAVSSTVVCSISNVGTDLRKTYT